MADIWTAEKRSEVMGQIRGSNTKPEIFVRKTLHSLGLRFTVTATNNKKLPGRPDIVLPKYNTVIFVHGCFWHQHEGCKLAAKPRTNKKFWSQKFKGNKDRDRRNSEALKTLGWKVRVIWECQVFSVMKNPEILKKFIEDGKPHLELG